MSLRCLRPPLSLTPLLLIAALAHPGRALANTCTSVIVAPLAVDQLYVSPNADFSSATCASRWWVDDELQYENGGTWHIPNQSPNLFAMIVSGGQVNCPLKVTWAGERACWGTDDGQGGGYFGAGNNRSWITDDIDPTSPFTYDPRCYNWRQAVKLYDYASGQQIGGTHYSPQYNQIC